MGGCNMDVLSDHLQLYGHDIQIFSVVHVALNTQHANMDIMDIYGQKDHCFIAT